MSFGQFLLEEGVEIEVDATADEVIAFLEEVVPRFSCDGYGYYIRPIRGILGSRWWLLVSPYNPVDGKVVDASVGLIKVEKREDGTVSFRIPPRSEWEEVRAGAFDEAEAFFAGFVFQTLNALQEHGFIQLPGILPVR